MLNTILGPFQLVELPAANPCSGLQAAAELRRRGCAGPAGLSGPHPGLCLRSVPGGRDAIPASPVPSGAADSPAGPGHRAGIRPGHPGHHGHGPAGPALCGHQYLECTHHVVHYHLPAARTWPPSPCGSPFPRWQSPCWPMLVFCSPTAPMWSTLPPPPSSLPGALDAQRGTGAHPPGARTRRKGGVPGVGDLLAENGQLLAIGIVWTAGSKFRQQTVCRNGRNCGNGLEPGVPGIVFHLGKGCYQRHGCRKLLPGRSGHHCPVRAPDGPERA